MTYQRTPAESRVFLAGATPEGRFSPSGLRAFQARFSTEASFDEFVKWRENPVTVAYLRALRSLAITPPASYVPKDALEVQFGVQSGLALAAQLGDDPTTMFPKLFSQPASGPADAEVAAPETDYSVAPDAPVE